MPPCHLLSHVQQQRIVTLLGNVYRGCKTVLTPYLLTVSFRRRHVDCFGNALFGRFLQHDTIQTGIQQRHSVVIPQQSVALTGDQHRNTRLRVHLC